MAGGSIQDVKVYSIVSVSKLYTALSICVRSVDGFRTKFGLPSGSASSVYGNRHIQMTLLGDLILILMLCLIQIYFFQPR